MRWWNPNSRHSRSDRQRPGPLHGLQRRALRGPGCLARQGSFDTRVASASGVGHDGQDLVIHCLAADRPGRAVDNPRQIAPYRYSSRYGRLPPCFARATVVHPADRSSLVLVGGTASIVGEASVHLGDLKRQTEETLVNLAVLLERRQRAIRRPTRPRTARVLSPVSRELRVYDAVPERRSELRALLADAFPRVREIEWMRDGVVRNATLEIVEGGKGGYIVRDGQWDV